MDQILTITLGFGLLFVVIEFSFAMYNMALLTKAVQVGGRVASLYWEDPVNPGERKLRNDIITAASEWADDVVSFSGETPSINYCWYSVDNNVDLNTCDDMNYKGPVQSGDSVLVKSSFSYSGPITTRILHLKFNLDLGKINVVKVE